MNFHAGPARFWLPGVPDLEVFDLTSAEMPAEEREALLVEFEKWHGRYFPERLYAADDVRQGCEQGWPDPRVIVHVWVFRHLGRTHGYSITHTNLRRCMGMVHYVAFDQEYRYSLPRGWLVDLHRAWESTGMADCARDGSQMLGMMGEVEEYQIRTWLPSGYRPVGVEYHEPVHGRHWPDHPPLQWFEMNPIVVLTEAGREHDYAEVVTAGFRAYLLDSYGLPEDEPHVAASLAAAAALPSAQPQ